MLNLAWGSSNQSVVMYSYLRFYQRAKIGYLEIQSVYLEREDSLNILLIIAYDNPYFNWYTNERLKAFSGKN